MMDDERIEQALRAGPPDETAYEGGAFDPALVARASASRYHARARNGRSGLFRIAATAMAAVLVVIGLLVVRSGNRTPELPAASEQLPSASPGLVSPTPSALASPTTPPTASASSSPSPSVLGGDAVAIANGDFHSCAITRSGGVECWGEDDAGQLGNGTRTTATAPTTVQGLASGVVAIAVGSLFSCALTSHGGVKCWGDNTFGELGDGGTVSSATPVDVVGLTSGVVALAAGGLHVCAVTTTGGISCWGSGRGISCCASNVVTAGILGNSGVTDSSRPVDVIGLQGKAIAIAAGLAHTCALLSDGGVACWGQNAVGQLGNGTLVDQPYPVRVGGIGRATSIAAGGDHACAIVDGVGQCWGDNAGASLGNGSTENSSSPVEVVGLPDPVAMLSPGTQYTCAVTTGGSANCWGVNLYGQLGDGSTKVRTSPVAVSGLSTGAAAIATGERHTCALTTGGAVECWGNNSDGQLGSGVARGIGRPTPVVVPGL